MAVGACRHILGYPVRLAGHGGVEVRWCRRPMVPSVVELTAISPSHNITSDVPLNSCGSVWFGRAGAG